jgi:hypothetical protein
VRRDWVEADGRPCGGRSQGRPSLITDQYHLRVLGRQVHDPGADPNPITNAGTVGGPGRGPYRLPALRDIGEKGRCRHTLAYDQLTTKLDYAVHWRRRVGLSLSTQEKQGASAHDSLQETSHAPPPERQGNVCLWSFGIDLGWMDIQWCYISYGNSGVAHRGLRALLQGFEHNVPNHIGPHL